MMQLNFSADQATNNLIQHAISPMIEIGAYEALWDTKGMSFKKLAELFQKSPNTTPSDHVPAEVAQDYVDKVQSLWKKHNMGGIGVRVHGAAEYPHALRDAKHPVELVYFQGWWDLVNTRSVAIVGSRNASPEGVRRAKKLGYLLAKADITIVSGLARGIDQAAHAGALKAGGRIIGVIGTPLTESYPAENRALQKLIAEEHLLVSQVPFFRYSNQGPNINRMFFPERNKVMSALTSATIIVEAGQTSGTLIQARAALEQNRKLFILQSCFENKSITWPANYEKKGAIRVKDIEDILGHLNA